MSTADVVTATPTVRRPAPQGQGARRSWHLRANAVVLVYLAAALLAVAGHDWLPVPRWLALHLLLLGAATNAIVTWTEHFAVALLRARPPSRRLSAGRLVGLNLAIVGVLAGVSLAVPPVVIASAVLLTLVVLAHLASLVRIARRAIMGRFAGTVRFYVVAGLALVAGITLGSLMAVRGGHDPWHERLHAAHVHANVFGWVGLSVLGTLFTLWPTVLRTRMVEHVMVAARRSLWLVTIGLAASVTGFTLGLRWAAVAGLTAYGVGVVLALQPFVRTWRRKAPREAAAWSMAAGTSWLAAGVVADIVLLTVADDVASYLPRLDALVPVLAVGFVLQTLLGALTYLVPVIRGGGPAGVRASTERLALWWRVRVVALNLGVALIAVGSAVQLPTPVTVATWALVTAPVAAFLGLVVAAVAPVPARGPLAGIALGLVMTLVPVAIAVSGQGPDAGPSSVTVHKSGGTQQVAVSLVGMDVVPAVIEVPAGTRLRLMVTNHDAMRHDLAFANGPSTPLLGRGRHAVLDLGAVSVGRSGWCTVPGHRAAGMTLDVRVVGPSAHGQHVSGAGPAAAEMPSGDGSMAAGMSGGSGLSGQSGMDAAGTSSALDAHGRPGDGWTPYDASLPPAPRAAVHRLTLHAVEREVEVAPGVRQRIWTFGGTAPGPTLHGRVGDLFEVTLVNDGAVEHGIDFHVGQNAPDQVMRSLAPGQSLVYRFRADHSGAWLYHCSTMPMAQHIANGMYGAVVIDPPNLPRVDREYVVVAAQLYVGSRSGGADADRIRAGLWDAATFNGYPDQYVHAPLAAKVGERVRWWVVAAGPSEGVDFHIVGSQFDTVFKEGAYLLRRGNAEHGASQVLDLAAAQGGFVEQVFTEPGHYSMIDHDMRRGENGARGIVEVTR